MAKKSNKDEMARLASRLGDVSKSIRFAGIVALTRTTNHGKAAVQKKMDETFTLRNSFSKRSVRITPARDSDRDPFAEVYVMDKYLAEQELGAERHSGSDAAIPMLIFELTGVSKNKVLVKPIRAKSLIAGRKALSNGNKPFVARSPKSGRNVLFVRKTDARLPLVPLYIFEGDQDYKITPKPFFFESVDEAFEKNLGPEYDKAFDQFVLRVKHD